MTDWSAISCPFLSLDIPAFSSSFLFLFPLFPVLLHPSPEALQSSGLPTFPLPLPLLWPNSFFLPPILLCPLLMPDHPAVSCPPLSLDRLAVICPLLSPDRPAISCQLLLPDHPVFCFSSLFPLCCPAFSSSFLFLFPLFPILLFLLPILSSIFQIACLSSSSPLTPALLLLPSPHSPLSSFCAGLPGHLQSSPLTGSPSCLLPSRWIAWPTPLLSPDHLAFSCPLLVPDHLAFSCPLLVHDRPAFSSSSLFLFPLFPVLLLSSPYLSLPSAGSPGSGVTPPCFPQFSSVCLPNRPAPILLFLPFPYTLLGQIAQFWPSSSFLSPLFQFHLTVSPSQCISDRVLQDGIPCTSKGFFHHSLSSLYSGRIFAPLSMCHYAHYHEFMIMIHSYTIYISDRPLPSWKSLNHSTSL